VSANEPGTIAVWDDSFGELIEFVGDPIGALAQVNAGDEAFVLGPVLAAACRVLGACSPDHPLVITDVERVTRRAVTPREVGHRDALLLLVAGEFGQAAARLDRVTIDYPHDLLAIRLAHDLYLHCGDAEGRLRSSEAAIHAWQPGERGFAVVAGQLAFAYEELGRYAEAERWGRAALDAEPGDAWARHAMAHVYESESRHADAVALLWDSRDQWTERTLFANHLWWHYALRMLDTGDATTATEVLDKHLNSVSAFDLCDATSLVWRMELAGLDVADRWRSLAQDWAKVAEVHNSAFVDGHAAMVFAAVDGADADRFWDGLAASHTSGSSENDVTFTEVVKPLAALLRAHRRGSVGGAGSLLPKLHRLGGSVIQRSIFADLAGMT
jgi:tetratricopeptide (TPR) repeat protein